MNFVFFLLPLLCSGSLLLPQNVSKINATALISSLTDANPGNVLEVRGLVDDLIAAGEVDRATATTARDDAQGVKDAAGTALQTATEQHTQTAGDLVSAQQEEERLTTLEDSKRVAKEAAGDAKSAAGDALTAAQGHLDSETIRLNEEKATLERILELLDSLNGGGNGNGGAWELAMNIHASDGHDFGYGAPEWNNGNAVGSEDTAHTSDFLDSAVWSTPAASIAIARHQNGVCEAVKVWKLLQTRSLQDYFQNERRLIATSGGPVYEYTADQMAGKSIDPIFGVDGDLALNWWYSNNGARIVLTGGHLADAHVNDDSTHGLGNEFGADTEHFQGSTLWNHDASIIQSGCFGTSCKVQGSDHGTEWAQDGELYGQYAIFVSGSEESEFQCEGAEI